MIKAGIIGGAGYTAGELLRLLIHHPQVEVGFVQSKSHSNQKVSAVHKDLLGETDLVFAENFNAQVDVLFLCSGHGKSWQFFEENQLPAQVKVVDLSTDFRITDESNDFVYGLPEAKHDVIATSSRIANPGCFATAIELAFLPLSEKNLLAGELNVTAITGSTGAGQNPTQTSHFSWKNNNIAVYKAFEHQHLAEIKQTLFGQDEHPEINFIPVRGNFSRGIMAMCYTYSQLDEKELMQLYTDYYANHPFVVISDQNPDVKQVVNTNKCVLYVQKHNNKAFVISVIDNLLKGASGQAVQNMNIMFGLEQTMGLQLKPVAF